jgi:hypothetical protein
MAYIIGLIIEDFIWRIGFVSARKIQMAYAFHHRKVGVVLKFLAEFAHDVLAIIRWDLPNIVLALSCV